MSTKFRIEDYIQLESWDDVVSRPAYAEEIDPTIEHLVEILAAYTFRDEEIRCGLKDCHQPHDHGFLVETSKGNETNIGRICGRNIFGAEFTVLANRFQESQRIRTYKQAINSILERRDHILKRVEELKTQPYGANWLYRAIRNFREKYPAEVVQNVTDRAKRGETAVESVRERTKEEIGLAMAANPGARRDALLFETVVVGKLRGLEIFVTNIRDLLIGKVEKRFREIDTIDSDTVRRNQLRDLYQWTTQVDDILAEAEFLIGDGELFFDGDNLALLKYLPMSDQARQELVGLGWKYEEGDAKSTRKRK